MTRLVVGLGNPGAEYDWTRHNLGFHVLDRLASHCPGTLFRSARRLEGYRGPRQFTWAELASPSAFLLKPETYMNLSGEVVAPVARFRLRNKGQQPLRSVEATGTFRRKGEEQLDWGSAWERPTPAGKPLAAGQSVLVVLKSDGRYYSSGEPASFFAHQQFKDALVTVYARVGSSQWVKFAELEVERRIGTKALEAQKP